MNVVRYEPWNILERFQNEVNRVMNDPSARRGDGDGTKVVTSQWTPAVDVKEEESRFVLVADVPGVKAEDIEITMDGGVLTIRGERVSDDSEEGKGFKRVERAFGSFYRRFSLPDSADAERVTATGNNGVLEISIPKQEKAQPRRISVS